MFLAKVEIREARLLGGGHQRGWVGLGFGCSFVVGSNRGEFDLILGLDLVLGFWVLIWLGWVFDLIYSVKEDIKARCGRR